MIISCNTNINKVYYSGYTISKIYACGGELVYSDDNCGYFIKVKYDNGTVQYKECRNGDAVINSNDILFNGARNYNEIWFRDCADCGITPTGIGGSIFANGEYLKKANLCSSIVSIGSCGFEKSVLEEINLENVTSIGAFAFKECSGLTSVNLQSIDGISRNAFQKCSGLLNVTIGSDIRYIYSQSFMDCSSLQYIRIEATTPPQLRKYSDSQTPEQKDWFTNTNDCPIYVPSASVNAYKTASEWTRYASRIQAIP